MRTAWACGSWCREGGGGLFPEAGRTLDFPLLSALHYSTALSNSGGLEGCVAEGDSPAAAGRLLKLKLHVLLVNPSRWLFTAVVRPSLRRRLDRPDLQKKKTAGMLACYVRYTRKCVSSLSPPSPQISSLPFLEKKNVIWYLQMHRC